jgi:two-component system response regulator RegA
MVGLTSQVGGASSARDVLLVIEDPTFRRRLASALERRGIRISCATSAEQALSTVASSDFWGAVTDLSDTSGLIPRLLDVSPRLCVLMLVGFATRPDWSVATLPENVRCRRKPLDADDVLSALVGEAPAEFVASGDAVEPPGRRAACARVLSL